jgi:hypothetical protein
MFLFSLGAALLAGAAGCTNYPAPRDAHFVHAVYFKFPQGLEGARAREFIGEIHDLAELPTVQSLWVGRPAPTRAPDRPMVDTNYDIGMIILFNDQKGLQDFLDHPDHVVFAKKWDALFEVRVFDFTPYAPGEGP